MTRINVLKRFDHAIPRLDRMTVDDMLVLLRTKFRFINMDSVDWYETDESRGIWLEVHMQYTVRLSHVGACSDDVFIMGPKDGTLQATLAMAVVAAKDAE